MCIVGEERLLLLLSSPKKGKEAPTSPEGACTIIPLPTSVETGGHRVPPLPTRAPVSLEYGDRDWREKAGPEAAPVALSALPPWAWQGHTSVLRSSGGLRRGGRLPYRSSHKNIAYGDWGPAISSGGAEVGRYRIDPVGLPGGGVPDDHSFSENLRVCS